MKINVDKLDKFVTNFKQTQDKVNNLSRDAIPVIKQELPKTLPNVNIETSSNINLGNKLPYVSQQSKQIKKLIETNSIIPIALPKTVSQPKLVSNNVAIRSNNKKQPLSKVGYSSAKITINWLFDINNN
jgi:isocitrate dehydrogenase kinase/phosphatase